MIQTAQKMGFSENQAEVLVEQTFMGAIHLLQSHNLTCAEWISKVASKGGTTEAAMKSFAADNLNDLIGKGLFAAQKRAVELGG
jgi:pyrroline-5-carboxylate reductase